MAGRLRDRAESIASRRGCCRRSRTTLSHLRRGDSAISPSRSGIERTMELVLEGRSPDTHLRLWLYPMLADHWMQMTGDTASTAVEYWEGAARAALSQNQNHEAIGFGLKELRLLKKACRSLEWPQGVTGILRHVLH